MAGNIPLSARYGISTFEPFGDVDARRHLLPSVMDDVPPLGRRCACPGGGGPENIECIEAMSGADGVCDACRVNCLVVKSDGTSVHIIDCYGPAYHLPERHHVTIDPHVGRIVIVSRARSTPSSPPVSPAGAASLAVNDEEVTWALAPSGKRVHAYVNRHGLWPRSLCHQSQMHSWHEVLGRETMTGRRCGTCSRLAI